MTTTFDFTEVPDDVKLDTIPVTVEVEHPCEKCGRETNWSGRGRRKRFCDECKPKSATTRAPRVNGNVSNTAAQAAKALVGINNMLAMMALAVGFRETGMQIMSVQEDFESQAYQALLADPKFAASLLSAGQISGKAMLGMAYLSMGLGIAPTFSNELRIMKAKREAARAEVE